MIDLKLVRVFRPRELPHTVIIYDGKPYLQINAIKSLCHHDWGGMRAVSTVIPFVHTFCTESNGKDSSFDIKMKLKNIYPREINDSRIFDIPTHDLENYKIKIRSQYNQMIMGWFQSVSFWLSWKPYMILNFWSHLTFLKTYRPFFISLSGVTRFQMASLNDLYTIIRKSCPSMVSSLTILSASFEHIIISQSLDGSNSWCDDRYGSKVFLSTIPTHDLKVKVMDLEVYSF